MLINTVVLLLRDLLPIVILLCFLRSFVASSAFSFTHIRNIAISSSLFVLLFIQIVEPISEWFMGAGLELIQVGFISVSFVLLVLITLLNIVGRKPILSKALTHLRFAKTEHPRLIQAMLSGIFIQPIFRFLHLPISKKS